MSTMLSQSCSGRAMGGDVTKNNKTMPVDAALARPLSPPSPVYHHHTHHAKQTQARSSFGDESHHPTKKRKLSLRTRPPHQTTLDHHWSRPDQSQPPKPPTKVTVAQPHGQLLETINGVRKPLAAGGDVVADLISAEVVAQSLRQINTRPAARRTSELAVEKKDEKRTLRSHDDGPRLKSELATYFSNYEDVMFDVQNNPEFITTDTVFYVTDDTATMKSERETLEKGSKGAHSRRSLGNVHSVPTPATPQRIVSNQFNASPSASLDMIARTLSDRPEDPLNDAHFFRSHRRAERKEKQLRNIERERAMHEKVQLERILDGLQGHDWLKVLGITGVTEGEAKRFDCKRNFYISEVEGLVDKFKMWKELEKRQRLDKLVKEAEESEQETDGSVDPPSSDLNASASRQLQQETVNAAVRGSAKIKINFSKHGGLASASGTPTSTFTPQVSARSVKTLDPPSPQEPITSFYAKRHLRDAALGKARQGRSVTAFGLPIPEIEGKEFHLPRDYLTEDTLRANAREKRRRKRASAVVGSSAPNI